MHKLLEPYAALVPFLGVALGDNVEIALHDLTSPEQEVVAIANGEISGREVGAKLSNLSVHYLETKQYEKSDYVMNYKTAGPDGKLLNLFANCSGHPKISNPSSNNSKVNVLYKVTARPATSNPGPKFALVAGTLTFTNIISTPWSFLQ